MTNVRRGAGPYLGRGHGKAASALRQKWKRRRCGRVSTLAHVQVPEVARNSTLFLTGWMVRIHRRSVGSLRLYRSAAQGRGGCCSASRTRSAAAATCRTRDGRTRVSRATVSHSSASWCARMEASSISRRCCASRHSSRSAAFLTNLPIRETQRGQRAGTATAREAIFQLSASTGVSIRRRQGRLPRME